ncbi:MAG: hypothetical protein WA958_09565 [Tunicatimonas sp.]
MIQNSLTFQLAHMALENQYDRPALCWDAALLSNDDASWKEELQLVEQVSALMLLDESFAEDDPIDAAQQEYEIEEAKSLYTFHLLIARLVFRNNIEMYEVLNLLGKREECLEAWTAQASSFYADLGHLSTAMAHYGITLTELRQAKAMVEALVDRYLR